MIHGMQDSWEGSTSYRRGAGLANSMFTGDGAGAGFGLGYGSGFANFGGEGHGMPEHEPSMPTFIACPEVDDFLTLTIYANVKVTRPC